jgi:hypothetical protein
MLAFLDRSSVWKRSSRSDGVAIVADYWATTIAAAAMLAGVWVTVGPAHATGRPSDVLRAKPGGVPAVASVATSSQQAAESAIPAPLITVISIAEQQIEVFGPSGRLARSRVSTGKPGHDTPTGVFSVLQRNRYHRSNIYSNAPMPFMQRLTWSGIALHQGVVPGYRASHGCIRLPGAFAQTMWSLGRMGMRVVVSPTRVAPVEISHANLPKPAFRSRDMPSASLIRVATAAGDAVGAPADHLLSPFWAARVRLERAIADKAAADRAVAPAIDLATAKSAKANTLSSELRMAIAVWEEAEEHLQFETEAMATVQTEAAEAAVLARIEATRAAVLAASETVDRLRTAEAVASDEAFTAAIAAREAERAAELASGELASARKGTSPASVFVSRKTGHVHVRQGLEEVLEAPVMIAEEDRPLGTHVFTAIEGTSDGAELRWVAVSVSGSRGDVAGRSRKSGLGEAPASSAGDALDRIELPGDVKAFLEERVWPGASLIVSDFGLGETNKGTDFVILTR